MAMMTRRHRSKHATTRITENRHDRDEQGRVECLGLFAHGFGLLADGFVTRVGGIAEAIVDAVADLSTQLVIGVAHPGGCQGADVFAQALVELGLEDLHDFVTGDL